MLTTEDLINSGYLPEEVIPPINTETLSKTLPNILANLENFLANRKTSKCCQFSIPRQRQFRRLLEIPNPLHQIRLSKTLEDSWSFVDNYLGQSKISLSRPKPQANSERAITPFIPYDVFGEVKSERILRSTASKYLLQADISRFYHSIYTHSIAWALHTKPTAKSNRGPTLLGNAIDKDVRNTRDGQTSGIPIGPDTSRIISEIIGTGIDIALEERLGYLIGYLNGVRHIDDFYLYFKSLADLEKGYSILQSVLQEFELELNPAKVDKIELPAESIESRWILEIRSFRFREDRANEQRDDLISYFDLAFRNAVLFPNEPVLDYAITKISSREIKRQNWSIFEALMLKTLIAEPKILPTILKVFLRYKTKGYELTRSKIKETLEVLLFYHSKFNHSFEISWTLWVYKSLRLKLKKEIVKVLSEVNDSVVALAALDLESNGLTLERFDKTLWRRSLRVDELYSESWLLAYEAVVKGWLSPDKNNARYIDSDPFFNLLRNNSVSFYDAGRQLQIT